jgi:hypothetical protein
MGFTLDHTTRLYDYNTTLDKQLTPIAQLGCGHLLLKLLGHKIWIDC